MIWATISNPTMPSVATAATSTKRVRRFSRGGHYFQMGGNLFLYSQFSSMPNGIQVSESNRSC